MVPVASHKPPSKHLQHRIRIALAAILLLYACWDLFGARSIDLRRFDPHEVSRLETRMWRSYYDNRKLPLFLDLAEMLRVEYHLPFLRSNVTAFYAAKAAYAFKQGHSRSDYERALPDLERFYSALNRVSVRRFDAHRAARLELEWWIAHRERSPQLEGDLAALQAEIFGIPAAAVQEHARLRAEAMRIRDGHGVWSEIARLLDDSWSSLAGVLQS